MLPTRTITFAEVLVVTLVMAGVSMAQLRSQDDQPVSAAQSLVRPATSIGSFLGLLNPDNFAMRQSVGFSYLSSGGVGVSLASYTNSMSYRIADPLSVRLDLTLQGSPFASYGSMQRDLSGLFVSRAELNYRPSDNTFFRLQFSQVPFGSYYRGYDDPFSMPLREWRDE